MTVARKTIRGRLTTLTEAQVQAGARITLAPVEVLEDGTTRTLPRVADLAGHLLMISDDTHYVTRDGDGSYTFSNVPVTDSDETSPTGFALEMKVVSAGEVVESVVFLLPESAPDEQWIDEIVALGDAPLTPSYPQLVNEAAASATAAAGSAATASAAATTATTQASGATTARTAAETAETAAQTAQGAASTSAGQAATSAGQASTSATAAQTARTAAETARTGAETARDAAAGSASTAATAGAAAGSTAGAAAGTTAATSYVTGQKGAANGLAPLDGSQKLPEANVPDRLSSTGLNNAYARLVGVQAVVSANGALVAGAHNPVDATSGNRTMTLADAPSAGLMVAVSKKDATANTVIVSVAHLRDGGAGSITLVGQFEALLLISKADGSWWPVGDHKTKAYFDATYAPVALNTRFDTEAILVAGAATTGTNMVPPGLRVPRATTINAVHVRVGTAPAGAVLTVVTKLDGVTVATTSVAATATSQSTTGLAVAAAAGQILTFDITSIGSTVPGSDVAVQVVGV